MATRLKALWLLTMAAHSLGKGRACVALSALEASLQKSSIRPCCFSLPHLLLYHPSPSFSLHFPSFSLHSPLSNLLSPLCFFLFPDSITSPLSYLSAPISPLPFPPSPPSTQMYSKLWQRNVARHNSTRACVRKRPWPSRTHGGGVAGGHLSGELRLPDLAMLHISFLSEPSRWYLQQRLQ